MTKRDVHLTYKNAKHVIHNAPQVYKDNAMFEGDVSVEGSVSIKGVPPMVLTDPIGFENTVTLSGAGPLGNLTTNEGDITATVGDILAGGDVTATKNVNAGACVELTKKDTAEAPVAVDAGTITNVEGALVWRVGTSEHTVSFADAYFMRDSKKVDGGGDDTICEIAIADGSMASIQGTVSAVDNTNPTKFAFFDVQALTSATSGTANVEKSVVTSHLDTITLEGDKVSVVNVGGSVFIKIEAHTVNACTFHADIRVCETVAVIP